MYCTPIPAHSISLKEISLLNTFCLIDAITTVAVTPNQVYYIYVRTYNWTSPWYKKADPGAFTLLIDGKKMISPLGTEGSTWNWQYAGYFKSDHKQIQIALHDLSGFEGRCDALYLTTERKTILPQTQEQTTILRTRLLPENSTIADEGEYDFIVVGGGVAGMCAAVSAARLGCKVALIHDRPILGGNNSSEVRVHLGGAINLQPYPNLGNMIKEFGHTKKGNAMQAENYEDEKKLLFVRDEPNISLFLNNRAVAIEKKGKSISAVISQDINSGRKIRLKAPVFADCTGDANIGYMAGADYQVGRESKERMGCLYSGQT